MRISSFLTFIIFCFLLFMEEVTEPEAAYINLSAQLDELLTSLENLQNYFTDTKIGELITDVKNAKERLGKKPVNPKTSKQEVKEDIDISNQVKKATDFISTFSTKLSNDLDELLKSIEKIWKDPKQGIQKEVNEAIATAPH